MKVIFVLLNSSKCNSNIINSTHTVLPRVFQKIIVAKVFTAFIKPIEVLQESVKILTQKCLKAVTMHRKTCTFKKSGKVCLTSNKSHPFHIFLKIVLWIFTLFHCSKNFAAIFYLNISLWRDVA